MQSFVERLIACPRVAPDEASTSPPHRAHRRHVEPRLLFEAGTRLLRPRTADRVRQLPRQLAHLEAALDALRRRRALVGVGLVGLVEARAVAEGSAAEWEEHGGAQYTRTPRFKPSIHGVADAERGVAVTSGEHAARRMLVRETRPPWRPPPRNWRRHPRLRASSPDSAAGGWHVVCGRGAPDLRMARRISPRGSRHVPCNTRSTSSRRRSAKPHWLPPARPSPSTRSCATPNTPTCATIPIPPEEPNARASACWGASRRSCASSRSSATRRPARSSGRASESTSPTERSTRPGG